MGTVGAFRLYRRYIMGTMVHLGPTVYLGVILNGGAIGACRCSTRGTL